MTHPTPQGQLSREDFDQFRTPNKPDGCPILMAVEINRLRAEVEALRADAASSLDLASRIRQALGDNGARMQPELIEWCRALVANDRRYRLVRSDDADRIAPDMALYGGQALDQYLDAALSQQSGSEVKNG